jgi:hypothetical protein
MQLELQISQQIDVNQPNFDDIKIYLDSFHLPRLPAYANEILSINEYIEERDQQTQKKKVILVWSNTVPCKILLAN